MKKLFSHIALVALFLLCRSYANAQDLEGMGLKKGIKVTGGLNISNIIYSTNDSLSRRDPYQLILSGNVNLNIFGYDAPFSFTYSNSQRSYTQPFNRLSFTPRYKWIKAYIGQTSMTFSPYTLSGHSFKGAGLELSPGSWRFAIMGGQLKRAVKYDPLTFSYTQPSFRRMGYGVKLGYEKAASGITVNLFTAKDDKFSIGENPGNLQIHPMENIALGISAHTLVLKHFMIDGEYSISILNSDTRFETGYDSVQTLKSLELSSIGTRRFDACSAGAGYQSSYGGLMLKYERVAPDYQSLGAYYFNNDMENFTVAPSLRLLDGKFSLNGNLGLQRNNLDKMRESTTKRFAGAGNMSLNISEKLNMTFNYSNFSSYTNVRPQEDPFFRNNMDTLNFYQVSNQAGMSMNYSFGSQEMPGSLMFFTTFQKAREAGAAPAFDFITANASYTRVLNSSGVSVSVLYSINSSGSADLKSCYQGPGVSLSKSFKDRNVRVSANSNFNLTKMNGIKGSPVIATGININYSPRKTNEGRHNLTGNLSWVQRFRSEMQASRREITGTINYSYNF